ncbi:DUF3343 domain-containing protein [Proteiniclasticum sp.]|jgi:hypothetical protein|uniref:DUF3343 domain-containing protein n=1 Tax=Proteiniclasticum sp. TaxID=2053595 RepID=UPI000E924A47|nr:DUF3343 domain-containing protein [Proteiniclasticum sp.]HBW12392.1 hypothetical protein [Proteiniclasticum sp.]
MDFYLLVFKNTTDALVGEEDLKKHEIPHAVYPTPPQIIGSCGISMRFTETELPKVEERLEKGLMYKALYKLSKISIMKIKENEAS